jgi:YbbR domain-containing protein
MVDNYVTNYRVPVPFIRRASIPRAITAPRRRGPLTISVSGPESIVNQIARIGVTFDVSSARAERLVRTALTLSYEDAEGNVLDDSLIEASSSAS